MDGQAEAIDYYKRLCKALLSKGERSALQKVLATFVSSKSFATLANDLPKILDSPRKRSLIPAIKALIPDQYHAQFDRALQHMGMAAWTTIDKQSAREVRKARVEQERMLQEEARKQLQDLDMNGDGDAFQRFLERQRELSRSSAAENPEVESQWGWMENDQTVKTLEFTEQDEAKYADVEDIDAILSTIDGQEAPPIPRRQSKTTADPMPPVPPRRSKPQSPEPGEAPPPVAPRKSVGANPVPATWLPEWYNCGSISRQEAESELRARGFTEGLFLVRNKGPGGVKFCLSIVYKQNVAHVLMDRPTINHPLTIDNQSYGGECYTPEEMVEAIRALGDRFEFQLVKPLRAP
ncbi:hypothetical protein PTSG_08986 [Salpingoeca rosetta]|uniref:SH2 domain-containing protein n=1 Tax=Salpingoeca rosetta (strain ATCC 50818 / BSB-021) TaxID=946362 RepID=F2ULV9_SALR5|nr:uncharacterized protein PTSG_08986 [Salpingoeca rosetta]EGD78108.1 hypothetical protein PTSG_08986 [Salpingoeca rosetta]|eukprot:XP_004989784.1 hypothetical protein PTSG_08986 [Salpingoeca rosetta]